MRVLSPDEILAADDLPREFVSCPEWANGDPEAGVYVRTMTGTERDAWELSVYNGGKQNLANVRARLAAQCVVDAEGKNLFDVHQVSALGSKSSAPLDRIFDVAQRLNGMRAEDIEDLAGN